jgi:triosephosphate isomerase (TIM)
VYVSACHNRYFLILLARYCFEKNKAVIPQKNGAFTAGVSPTMLKSINVDWCLAGHSERRALYNEDDNNINLQVKLLIEMEINVVLCIGESADEYENQLARAICEVQLRKGLSGVTAEQMKFVTIAYEPVWAIGTGKVATPEIAQNIHSVCRDILRDMYGSEIADSTHILYGGSVSPDSVDGLMAKPDIDGALVGGASLKAESFGRIINFVAAKQAEYA